MSTGDPAAGEGEATEPAEVQAPRRDVTGDGPDGGHDGGDEEQPLDEPQWQQAVQTRALAAMGRPVPVATPSAPGPV